MQCWPPLHAGVHESFLRAEWEKQNDVKVSVCADLSYPLHCKRNIVFSQGHVFIENISEASETIHALRGDGIYYESVYLVFVFRTVCV